MNSEEFPCAAVLHSVENDSTVCTELYSERIYLHYYYCIIINKEHGNELYERYRISYKTAAAIMTTTLAMP